MVLGRTFCAKCDVSPVLSLRQEKHHIMRTSHYTYVCMYIYIYYTHVHIFYSYRPYYAYVISIHTYIHIYIYIYICIYICVYIYICKRTPKLRPPCGTWGGEVSVLRFWDRVLFTRVP